MSYFLPKELLDKQQSECTLVLPATVLLCLISLWIQVIIGSRVRKERNRIQTVIRNTSQEICDIINLTECVCFLCLLPAAPAHHLMPRAVLLQSAFRLGFLDATLPLLPKHGSSYRSVTKNQQTLWTESFPFLFDPVYSNRYNEEQSSSRHQPVASRSGREVSRVCLSWHVPSTILTSFSLPW